jgi:hypothetical protein
MLLQTNSYLVPNGRRAQHARLIQKFVACFERLGGDIEVYEQTAPGFEPFARNTEAFRFAHVMRFRDHEHQQAVATREAQDQEAVKLIAELVELVDLRRQRRDGRYIGNFYRQAIATVESSSSP